jgi:hypothetical protein
MKKLLGRLSKSVQRLLNKIKDFSAAMELLDEIYEEDGKTNRRVGKKCRQVKMERKNTNSHRTTLPKRIYVKTLLLSVAANQPMDALIMDLSQLDSDGIAHYMVSRTLSKEGLAEEYLAFGGGPMGAMAAIVGGDINTVQVNGAWIWETDGIWDWEEDSSS